MTNVFGAKFVSTLSRVDICLGDEGTKTPRSQQAEATLSGGQEKSGPDKNGSPSAKNVESSGRKIWGMVSKAGEGVGRADNDRQFLYLNGRPVDLPKVANDSCGTPVCTVASDRSLGNMIFVTCTRRDWDTSSWRNLFLLPDMIYLFSCRYRIISGFPVFVLPHRVGCLLCPARSWVRQRCTVTTDNALNLLSCSHNCRRFAAV